MEIFNDVQLDFIEEETTVPLFDTGELYYEIDTGSSKEFIGQCRKRIYYRLHGYEPEVEDEEKDELKSKVNQFIKLELLKAFKNISEGIVNDKMFGEVHYYHDGERLIMIKSGAGNLFEYQVNNGYKKMPSNRRFYLVNELLPAPREYELLQAGLLLKLVPEFNTVLLIYVNRTNFEMYQFLISYDEHRNLEVVKINKETGLEYIPLREINIDKIYENMGELYENLDNIKCDFHSYYTNEYLDNLLKENRISKRKYNSMIKGETELIDWQCKYCPYLKYCKEN